ncbi:unnamed protein product [Mesocestoides corti]|uniref:Small acidic protein n=1 Tax=Mesocestoides corti TaxID=53468 RepID=A0A0R3U2S6_MESCO|nr:unnamed protein product [Mesocestoides corti]
MGKAKKDEKKERRASEPSSKHKHKHKSERRQGEKKGSSTGDAGVHSANAWEDVKFDSKDRKEKFLRLMGAKKHQKQSSCTKAGEEVVTHTRAGVNVQKIGENLERQFVEGLEHKSSRNRHAGLGCSSEGSLSPSGNLPIRLDREEEPEKSAAKSGGKYLMNFVKSCNE